MKKIIFYLLFMFIIGGIFFGFNHIINSKPRVASTPESNLALAKSSNNVVISVPQLPPSSVVFGDALNTGWYDTSWNSNVSTTSKFAYSHSALGLSVEYQNNWSGLYLQSSGFNPKSYASLSLALNIGLPENEDLYLSLYTDNGVSLGAVPLVKYVPKFSWDKNVWYKISVPLSDLNAVGKNITGVVVESSHPSQVYFDEIKFSNDKSTKYIPVTNNPVKNSASPISALSMTIPAPPIKYPESTQPIFPNDSQTTSSAPINKIENKTPITSQNIYFDSLLSGWTIEDMSLVDLKSGHAYNGDYAMHINFQGSWSEVHLIQNDGVDVSGYSGLYFAIKGEHGDEDVRMIFYGTDGSVIGTARVSDFVANRKLPANQYTLAYIPFRTIALKGNIVGKIILTSQDPASVFIDNLQWSDEPSNIPAGGYYVTNDQVFDGGMLNAWYLETFDAEQKIVADSNADKNNAVQVKITAPGGSLNIKNSVGMDPSYQYHHLRFSITGSALSGPKISLALYDTKGKMLGSVWINDFLQSSDFTQYQIVTIPLQDIGGENSLIGSVVISSGSATDLFYLDNIKFEF
jgi:hypothetical protein